jgi:hypothetical protein
MWDEVLSEYFVFLARNISHMLHTKLHVQTAVVRRTSGSNLGTLKKTYVSGIGERWLENYVHTLCVPLFTV